MASLDPTRSNYYCLGTQELRSRNTRWENVLGEMSWGKVKGYPCSPAALKKEDPATQQLGELGREESQGSGSR